MKSSFNAEGAEPQRDWVNEDGAKEEGAKEEYLPFTQGAFFMVHFIGSGVPSAAGAAPLAARLLVPELPRAPHLELPGPRQNREEAAALYLPRLPLPVHGHRGNVSARFAPAAQKMVRGDLRARLRPQAEGAEPRVDCVGRQILLPADRPMAASAAEAHDGPPPSERAQTGKLQDGLVADAPHSPRPRAR